MYTKSSFKRIANDLKKLAQLIPIAQSENTNTHQRGKYQCTADLLFDWFGFDQTSKAIAN